MPTDKVPTLPAKAIPVAPRGPWPEDVLIRESAFTIHDRPANGEPVWSRGGNTYTHREALAIARREAARRNLTEAE